MFRTFLIREKVMPRLIAFRDGERRITNLLHLAEILHRTVFEQHQGIAELVNWMAQLKKDDSAEEYLVRLESEADAVQLVTVHKSKGLEYPIVFCPFLWDDFNANWAIQQRTTRARLSIKTYSTTITIFNTIYTSPRCTAT